MAQSLIQRAFAGGEIAPALSSRADQTKYQTGAKRVRNFQVMKHGGLANRAGNRYIGEVLDSAQRCYFLTFVFNDEQTYVIEAGDEYFRFYRNGGQIVVSGVAAYNGGTTYAKGDLVEDGGINYYSRVDGNVGNTPAISPVQWYALDGDIFEVPTPFSTAEIPTLEFVQSGDVVTITSLTDAVQELTRTGHTAWRLDEKSFAPSISAPTGVANSGAAGTATEWVVTSVKADTFEESLQSSSTGSSATPSSGSPITITWTQNADAQEYNVYKKTNDLWGFIGIAGQDATPQFIDNGITASVAFTPPQARTPFASTDNYPQAASYYQQRLMFGNTNNDPEKVWGSRSGMFGNLTISAPLQSDDAVTFTVAGRKVNEVRYLVDIGTLVILTASGEWIVEGGQDGTLVANQPPNLRQIGYNGSAKVTPQIVNDSLIFVQARQNVVRDLRYTVGAEGTAPSYKGKDLTVFATHLFKNKAIERMAYAQNPHSIIWAVRSDGILLGLTYLTDHEIWGWHWHDTDGFYEDVCVVPEGQEDAVYVLVRRVVNGVTKRYIERLQSRDYTDIMVDAVFMDSYLSYDGRNTSATTLTLSTGAGWTVDDDITITASAPAFVSGDVGNSWKLDILDADGEITDTVTIEVHTFTDTTHVIGTPSKTVPVALQGVATDDWTRMVDELAGADHLEAKNVSVFADGNVVASPNNNSYTTITVTAGAVALPRAYGVIHVGLPYLSDMQTLDIDNAELQVRDRKKRVTNIGMLVEDTRGIFIGSRFPEDIPEDERQDVADALEGMTEVKSEQIENYDTPWPTVTGYVDVAIQNTWRESGSFCTRQVDPLPITILAAIPHMDVGG